MNIILTGVKGSSKSTMEKLITNKNMGFNKVVSYTTRKPRNGEADGVDYHFISDEEYVNMISNNEFAEVVSYNDVGYGIATKDLLNGYDNVIVVEIDGLRQILNTIPREELFIVKLDCDIREQINRIINRDKLDDYDEIIKLVETLKADRKHFQQQYDYDFKINTTNYNIDYVLSTIMQAFGTYNIARKQV